MVKTGIAVPSKIDNKNNPEYHKAYYVLNRDKIITKALVNQKSNAERVKEKNRKWREDNPERNETLKRESFLRIRWGITLNQYNMILQNQDGVCAICENPQKPYLNGKGRTIKYLAVDHDHRTGKIRGLLCSNCNRLLGQIEKNPELISKAQEYLERNY